MSIEYLGKVDGIITNTDLSLLAGISKGILQNPSDTDIVFEKFKYGNEKVLLIPTNVVRHSISWKSIDENSCVYGKDLLINNEKYNCRLMTGLKPTDSTQLISGGEWLELIESFNLDKSFWGSRLTWCQESSPSITSYKIVRGSSSASYIGHNNPSISDESYSWRPVLEYTSRCKFSISNHDLGNITSFTNIDYSVECESFSLTEELDGVVIRTLENQTNGTYTLDLSAKWESISYGKHNIKVVGVDKDGLTSTVSITFYKTKEITKPLPITSSLEEFVNNIENFDKDIDYLRHILSDNLNSKGIECNSQNTLSTLIGNVNNIDSVRFGYGDTLLLASDNFQTPLRTSIDLKNAYYNTFNVNNIFRDRVNTYTLNMNLSHSTINRTNFTFIICDSQQTILHEINIPVFKYAIDISIDLEYLPNDNILGFYMFNETTSSGLVTKCNLSCDIQFM